MCDAWERACAPSARVCECECECECECGVCVCARSCSCSRSCMSPPHASGTPSLAAAPEGVQKGKGTRAAVPPRCGLSVYVCLLRARCVKDVGVDEDVWACCAPAAGLFLSPWHPVWRSGTGSPPACPPRCKHAPRLPDYLDYPDDPDDRAPPSLIPFFSTPSLPPARPPAATPAECPSFCACFQA